MSKSQFLLSFHSCTLSLVLAIRRHFIPVGASMDKVVMKHARDVAVGDVVLIAPENKAAAPATITHIMATIEAGLYNPYTRVRIAHALANSVAWHCFIPAMQLVRA